MVRGGQWQANLGFQRIKLVEQADRGAGDKDGVHLGGLSDSVHGGADRSRRDRRNHRIAGFIERGEDGDFEACIFDEGLDACVDVAGIGRENADAGGPEGSERFECRGNRVGHRRVRLGGVDAFGNAIRANDHAGRGAAVGNGIDAVARQQGCGCVGHAGLHRG